jgi:hypothetical protein
MPVASKPIQEIPELQRWNVEKNLRRDGIYLLLGDRGFGVCDFFFLFLFFFLL